MKICLVFYKLLKFSIINVYDAIIIIIIIDANITL